MKLLFVKIGALGDVVQAAVALLAWRAARGATVHWVCDAAYAGFIERCGVADRVISINAPALIRAPLPQRLTAAVQALWALRGARFDLIATAHSDRRYTLLTAAARAPVRRNLAQRLGALARRSRVYEYWRLLEGTDAPDSFDLAAATAALGQRVLAAPGARAPSSLPEGAVVLAPGGARNLLRDDGLRRWPIGHYRTLCQALLRANHPVALCGSAQDHWVRDAFVDLPVIDLIGTTTLADLPPLFARARAVVTHDSGPLHLASLCATPLVALFGPTAPNAVLPLGRARTAVLAAGNRVACSPCYDGRDYAPCPAPRCLQAIAPEAVLAALHEVW